MSTLPDHHGQGPHVSLDAQIRALDPGLWQLVEDLATTLGRTPARIVADALAQYGPIREPALWPEPAPAGPRESPEFTRFWAAYPRHTEKKAARRAWDKAAREASPQEIIAAAAQYAAWVQQSGTTFVKHPATWLNKGCWMDEPEQPPPPPEQGTWQ